VNKELLSNPQTVVYSAFEHGADLCPRHLCDGETDVFVDT